MKGDHQLIGAIVVFFIGAAFGSVLDGKADIGTLGDYLAAAVTLAAAFGGAWFAYRLQKEREEKKELEKQVSAGNHSIFNVMQMYHVLKNYQNQYIDPIRHRASRAMEMAPSYLLNDSVDLDLNRLSFLLDTSDKNILMELHIENSKYEKAIQAINERSRMQIENVQPLLEKSGVLQGDALTDAEIESAIGNRLFVSMQDITENVINHVDTTVLSLKMIGDNLTESMIKNYPGSEIMKIVDE